MVHPADRPQKPGYLQVKREGVRARPLDTSPPTNARPMATFAHSGVRSQRRRPTTPGRSEGRKVDVKHASAVAQGHPADSAPDLGARLNVQAIGSYSPKCVEGEFSEVLR